MRDAARRFMLAVDKLGAAMRSIMRASLRGGLMLAAVLLLTDCQGGPRRPACPDGQRCLEYGNNTEPLTLDPQKSNLIDEASIIGDLMMGLTVDAPDASPAPGIAQSWETSADGLTWTFHLRDAKWSDGAPVTADDFVFGLRRLVDPKTASIYAYLAYVVKNAQAVNEGKADPATLGVRAVDPRTLVITLTHPAPYLPEILKHQSFFPAPRHVVERWGDAWVQPGHYVSDGAYRLVAWKLGDHVRVEKNPYFWDADKVCFDRVNYYPTPDSISAERRVASGELDLNTRFQSNRIDRLRDKMPGYAHTHVSLATSYLSLNTRDVAAFKDIRVRRALSEAIDRDFITKKLMRAGEVSAYAFVPPGIANYESGARLRWAALPYAQRVTQARALLAQAGYGPDNPLKVVMKTADSPGSLLLVQAIQADWKQIGVEASTVVNEGQVAFAAYRAGDFQVGLMSWYADFNDPTTFLGLMKSDTGAQNYAGYSNPAYDALIDRADDEPDPARRAAILRRAEQLMLDDEAVIPIYFVVNRNLVSPTITGWVDNAENFHRVMWMCRKGPPPGGNGPH